MLLILATLGCKKVWEELPDEELAARDLLKATPIALEGVVVGIDGPIAGAEVELEGQSTVSDASGAFRLEGLERHNALLTVSASGYRDRVLAAQLLRELTQDRVDLGAIALSQELEGSARFRMVGDVSLGRRFLDPDEEFDFDVVPEDDEEALIQASDPYPGSAQTLDFVRRFFDDADYATCNLETVVTDTPDTPHTGKPYIFFTLPGSLPALAEVFDYIAEGNNHVYDYLEPGVVDTLDWSFESGMGFSGLGRDSDEAFAAHDFDLGTQRFAMISMTSVAGSQYEVGFVATDERGGAADLRDDDAVLAEIDEAVVAGRAPILQLHFGKEYSETPSDYALGRLDMLAESQAALMVGHHPHVAQGFGWHGGTLAAHSLGNFIFDQDRLETMQGLIWRVDMVDQHPYSSGIAPVYLEDYRPRPLVGRPAERLLRRVAQASVEYSAEVVPGAGQALLGELDLSFEEQRRSEQLSVTIGEDGLGVADLRGLFQTGESLLYVDTASSGVSVQPGRDQLLFGGFEDVDVDPDWLEAARWDLDGASREVCVGETLRGAGALCTFRGEDNSEDSITWYRNRVRLQGPPDQPNRDISLVAWRKGDNAGRTHFELEWAASEGDATFGSETVASRKGGSYGWELVFVDIEVPTDELGASDTEGSPRALRLEIHHSPPEDDLGIAWFDEVALVNWQESLDASAGAAVEAPNPYEFLRVEGPPGEHILELSFSRWEPSR